MPFGSGYYFAQIVILHQLVNRAFAGKVRDFRDRMLVELEVVDPKETSGFIPQVNVYRPSHHTVPSWLAHHGKHANPAPSE
jgi:hypothetical protein